MLPKFLLITVIVLAAACAEEPSLESGDAPSVGASDVSPIRTGRVTLINGDSTTLPFVNHYSPTLAYGPDMLFLSPDSTVSLAADS